MKREPNEQIIESFEKQLDIFINALTEKEITTAILNNFFDKVINNLKNERLINDIIFDIYQGKTVITKPIYSDYIESSEPKYNEHWQKFYSFNRNLMIESTLIFIAKNLKKASLTNKLYYSFAKLAQQLDLNAVSDHFMKKIDNYITFNNL
ncbi:hypothetical protein [Rickettsia rickettsii]|uniref:Uncharacterized protein n=2 Tax=Rickettsia rickettsii TaxID=783 RepID=B0BUR4_RICRO|nr:hypothetical protein [Rickettsia rickettsii]ABV76599.1 hypothetical protein A1G_05580 [Rickettsia rickettsii str. 'Sheila Smith']ABY72974.1 hypothetical protein RrIowa_1203 [Rickettsia rickettsii str. Iowa]AFB21829.1 hypothetical protein RPN_01400 [Rickettsia rickettsii str. Brazil]AFB23951.1 hypothetical protein RPL_05625 [Rickettsia rickettsii str. Colombia]AFB25297.1 hypothetical protein RPO_05645 [Rickettsia rickettsii str. Arizona]